MIVTGLDREQIEALKRQVEEDYKLDIAAIERFQRRFTNGNTSSPASTNPPAATTATVSEIRQAVVPIPEPAGQSESDELTGSLRSMFSTYRR